MDWMAASLTARLPGWLAGWLSVSIFKTFTFGRLTRTALFSVPSPLGVLLSGALLLAQWRLRVGKLELAWWTVARVRVLLLLTTTAGTFTRFACSARSAPFFFFVALLVIFDFFQNLGLRNVWRTVSRYYYYWSRTGGGGCGVAFSSRLAKINILTVYNNFQRH